MKLVSGFLAVVVLATVCIFPISPARGFDVVWSTGNNFTGPTGHQNISTAGVHFQAISFGESVDRTVDTGTELITFEGLLRADTAPNTFDGTPFENPNSPGSSSLAWNDIMRWQNWSTSNTGDFQLSGLTIGNTYQVEIFVWDTRPGTGGDQTQFWSDEEGNDSSVFRFGDGISTIGTFVADAGNELIKGTMVQPRDEPVITAYSLRLVAEVPEPGSMTFLLAIGLTITTRRRRRP